MEHNLAHVRSQLLQSKLYAASPMFLQGVGWQADPLAQYGGNVLVDKASGNPAIVSVVGRVQPQRLFVGGNGNFLSRRFGDLATAKFQMNIARTGDKSFDKDFDQVLDKMGKIERQVAESAKRENFIMFESGEKVLRVSRAVFQRRVSPFLRAFCQEQS